MTARLARVWLARIADCERKGCDAKREKEMKKQMTAETKNAPERPQPPGEGAAAASLLFFAP